MIVKCASIGSAFSEWGDAFKSPAATQHLEDAAVAVNESIKGHKATSSLLKSLLSGAGSAGRFAVKHPAVALGVGIPVATGLTYAALRDNETDSEF